MLGINTIDISTSAKACSPCNSVPLDIQLVVDRTGSMSASGGSTNGLNKWQNLQQGVLQGFLPGLDSGIDNVGLTTLPPDVNGTNDICQAATSNNYNSTTPTYTVVPLSNTYMDSAGNLIPGSPLVSDINCMKPGGGTDYADAMTAAYNELNLHNRPGVQKIIVLLSDGAANFGQNCVTKTVNGKQVKDTQAPLHPTLPISRQRRRHLQSPRHPDLHHPLRRPNHRPRLPRLHRRQRSPLPTTLDSHASHRQPRKLLPRPQPHQPRRHLPTNRLRHGRRHQPHRRLTHPRHGNAAVQAPRDPSLIA